MSQSGFNQWRRTLSRHVNREIGLSMNKLPDFPLKKWWGEGLKVEDALEIIKDEMGGFLPDRDWESYL